MAQRAELGGLPALIGLPLESLHLNLEGVPAFLPVVCAYIRQFRSTVGLFRLSGNHVTVQELTVVLNFPQVSILPSATIHDVTSFLKFWIRALPVPIITPAAVNAHFVAGNPDTVADVLMALADVNRKAIAVLFATLKSVLDEAAVNQMNWNNLAICFNTSLLQSGKDLTPGFKLTEFFHKAIELLNDEQTDFRLPDVINA
jgi:hypothetical protein